MRKSILVMLSVSILLGLTACGTGTPEAKTETTTVNGNESAVQETAETQAGSSEVKGTSEAAEESVEDSEKAEDKTGEKTEIQVFIAASLKNVMQEIADNYNEIHPEVDIVFNADSSGKLLSQIEEGYACDVFFSAAQKQMDKLSEEKLLVPDTRKNVVNNQVCVITLKDSGTKVTGLQNISDASSIALADGTVPVGKYTREAMIKLGLLPETDDASKITTQEISDALNGVEISEQSNVSKVLAAVTEGSCEVGTTYYSDTYGFEDKVEIIEKVPYELSGNVIYPIAQVVNEEADDKEKEAALDFVNYVTGDASKEVFEKYYFDTDIQN
ncbi:molybdate ABC transporter substrate-binding protein [Oribacterium sp. WCC10]|uniref:molybdate ABC transporter substrate-binding protein n=1 Tax=Oribacterium sp. WCC10 TaxID=1855343 RepID=UPI0008E9C812|nr:molybdate ABC transporter substrate-binding protein [Oribacterium sp. WCC10]SFG29558.1 molybdate transport system substrate-binding protein [Oribacterium sp. WCC10]